MPYQPILVFAALLNDPTELVIAIAAGFYLDDGVGRSLLIGHNCLLTVRWFASDKASGPRLERLLIDVGRLVVIEAVTVTLPGGSANEEGR